MSTHMTCICGLPEGTNGDCERCELIGRARKLERLVDKHAAEINRRRGEMAVAREFLDECGVAKEINGSTLTFLQRLKLIIEPTANPKNNAKG